MSLMELATEKLVVEKQGGKRTGPFKGTYDPSKHQILILEEKAGVDDGDVIVRELDGGRSERFVVEEAEFQKSPFDRIPSFHQLKVRKETRPPMSKPNAGQTINIHSAGGVQIGDNNTQNIVAAVQQLSAAIEASSASEAEKTEAKGLLQEIVEHPVFTALLGAAAGSVMNS